MAKFRDYKNGINGHKYCGLYIIRTKHVIYGEDGEALKTAQGKDRVYNTYHVQDEENNVLYTETRSYDDCEWFIDKYVATPERQRLLESLYQEEIYKLSGFLSQLMEKERDEGLTPKEQELKEFVSKIRARKADNKEF